MRHNATVTRPAAVSARPAPFPTGGPRELCGSKREPWVISYNASISACEKGQHWAAALVLLQDILISHMEPDVISYSAAISACEKAP